MFDVGDRIIELRQLREWSQSELARRSGISQSALSNIERNKKQPNIVMLERICVSLDVSLHAFFQLNDEHIDSKVLDAAKRLLSLPENKRRHIMDGIKLLSEGVPESGAPGEEDTEKDTMDMLLDTLKHTLGEKEPETPMPHEEEAEADAEEESSLGFASEIQTAGKFNRFIPLIGSKDRIAKYQMETFDDIPEFAILGIRIHDDSMEPKIGNGSIVWVQNTPILANNQVGVFLVEGKTLCRRFMMHEGRILLVPYNPEYPLFIYDEYHELKVVGKVLNQAL